MTILDRLRVAAVVVPGCLSGCDPPGEAPDTGPGADAGAMPDAGPSPADRTCSPIFAQALLPEYHVEISATEWAALEEEFLDHVARQEAGLDPHPYHPVTFRHDGEEVPGVLLRLKGNSSWRDAVELDARPKMQFVIAFNEVDPDGRFHGVRKLELDMPRNDRSFLRQRLALYYLRGQGLEAQCANSARLVINGAYYGLYTGLERIDKEFLQRNFPGDDDGDLWEGGRTLQTNEDSFTWERLNAFWAVEDTAALAGLADLDAAVREWAAEAMIPDGDGYQAGRPNFMLYDHPDRGFVWIADDLDASFDFAPPDASPVFGDRSKSARQHFQLVMDDPAWFERYVDALAGARDAYAVDELAAAVSAWSAQIADAAADDPMKPFTTAEHRAAVEALHQAPARRAAFVDAWLACRDHGGPDGDGDGHDLCHDCADGDPAVHPGAEERCDGLDDDCDGVVDETCP